MNAARAAFSGWNAARYLSDYYSAVAQDEAATLRFLVDALAEGSGVDEALEFGAGPTVHHALALAPHARAIDVADLLDDNLRAVRCWADRRSGAHDWSAFTRHVLQCEGTDGAAAAVAAREALTRRRLRRALRADASHAAPLGPAGRRRYGTVVTCFCADSATADKPTWAAYMRNIAGLVAPGGRLLLAALRRCTAYRVGGVLFPSADVDERDLAACLGRNGFDPARTRIEIATAPQQRRLGYDGIVLACAERRVDVPAPAMNP